MPWPVHPNGLLGAQGDNDSYRIERSLRFNDDDTAYLTRTFGTPTDGKKCTLSLWYKRGNLGGALSSFGGSIFAANSSNFFSIADNSGSGGDELMLWYGNARTLTSTAKFRDPTSWYHLVIAFDSTQATAANRCRVYMNGSEVTSWSTDARTNITLNSTITFNTSAISALISGYQAAGVGQFDGYLAEYYFIDGQALTPSSFGETDAITGRWKAKAYSGTYGTNGFYLKFSDNSSLTTTSNVGIGKDFSGNGNYWATNGLSVTAGAGNDSLVDSPTNYGTDTGVGGEVRGNYCTLNPLSLQGGSLSNGNLDGSTGGVAPSGGGFGTWAIPQTGKWYWEFMPNDGNGFDSYSGISGAPASNSPSVRVAYYGFSGDKEVDGVTTAYGATYGQNDIIGVAVNSDSGVVTFYKNGVSQGNITYSVSGKTQYPWFADGSSARNTSFVFNFGQRPFAYTAPSGFKALCTTNLPTPTIKKPSSAIDVVTYTGNGSARSITGLGFSPDLVWIKGRNGVTDHAIYDSVRGVQKDLGSNMTTDETTQTQGLTAFNSDGFDIGTLAKINTNTSTYVAWAWDRAAIDGLDIVSYTGNGANRTIAHNLGVAPKMIIVKARTTAGTDQGWPVWHESIPNTNYLMLDTTALSTSGATYWNSTSPTASVFSLGTNAAVNANNDTYIAYLFAEVEGFSRFGSYTGNASADGPFVWCGFRPRWVMTKSSGGTTGYAWIIHDTARNPNNVADLKLVPNNNEVS